jgi:PAS domain S-box-containing protein
MREWIALLASAATPKDVALAAIRIVVDTVGADRAAFWVVDRAAAADADALVLLAHHGIDAQEVERHGRMRVREPSPVAECFRRAQSTPASLRKRAHESPTSSSRPRGLSHVPLTAGGEPIGVLGYRARGKGNGDAYAFVAMVASLAALALDRFGRRGVDQGSAGKLEAYFQSSPAAMIVIESDAAVSMWNPAAERIFGWTAAEAVGRPLPFIPESEHEEYRARLARVIRGEPILGERQRRRTRSGGSVQIAMWAAAVRGPGQSARCMAIVFDETDHRTEGDPFHTLTSIGAALAASLDLSSTIATLTWATVPDFADAIAIEFAEDIRRPAVYEHTDSTKRERLRALCERYHVVPGEPGDTARVLRTGEAQLFEYLDDAAFGRLVSDGERAALMRALGMRSILSAPLLARGRVIGSVTFIRGDSGRRFDPADVSAAQEVGRRAALAIDNALLYEDSVAANRAKDEFLSIVSHELRTPLNAILGWASILSRDLENRQTIEHGLRVIERNAKVQAKLIEDILDVSRIISGKLRIDQRAVDLGAVMRASVDTVRANAEGKGIEISLDIAEASCLALGDAERLQQVFSNLLSNAVKFTSKGGHVWVKLSRRRNAFTIEVRDDGKGIDPALLPHVFERFRQGDSSTKRAHGGLGLGLAIARHLVDAHGGTIHAASTGLGKGAVFTVRIPIPAVLSIDDVAPDGGSTPYLPLDTNVRPSLKGRRLLVVDDEADARELVVVALRSAGADVSAVASAGEAFRAIAEDTPPDVLISDISMPDEDGFELIRRVRALPGKRGKLPAIALTAYARPEDARQVFMAGFQVHLPKPVDAGLLTAAVANLAG